MRFSVKRSDLVALPELLAFCALCNISMLNKFFGTTRIRLLIAVILLLLILIRNKKRKIFTMTVVIEVAYFCILLSTVVNRRSLYDAFANLIPQMGMLLLFDYGLNRNRKSFIRMITITLVTFVLINFITLIIYPNGMYMQGIYSENWFLGYKNVHVRFIIPALALVLTQKNGQWKKDILCYVFIAIGIVSCILAKSSTAIVGILLFVALIIGDSVREKNLRHIVRFFLKPSVLVPLAVLANYLVLTGNNLFISGIVQEWLGKDLTFTGRVYIWERCVILVQQNLFLGLGYVNSEDFYDLIAVGAGAHPHNYVLGWWFYGGIVALAMISLAYIYIIRQNKHRIITGTTRIYMWAIVAFFIMGITDVGLMSVLFHPLFLLYESEIREQVQA